VRAGDAAGGAHALEAALLRWRGPPLEEFAVALAAELAPDVVLMDLHMPVLGGVEATARIVDTTDAAVVVLTMVEDESALLAALRAGATGYPGCTEMRR
jgi:DNA-binding NarL/FixJ family response regulator